MPQEAVFILCTEKNEPSPGVVIELYNIYIPPCGDQKTRTDIRLNRVIRIAGGNVSTLAGGNIIDSCSQNIGGRAQEGNEDGKALTALFNFPQGIAYDSKGNLFIADMNKHSIRKLSPDGMVTTLAK